MNLPELLPLLDLAQGVPPVAAIGALFPFLGKDKEGRGMGRDTLNTINRAVNAFLEQRGVENFKVYTIAYDDQPIVLIKAEPQKKLRFSNIIEIQIRKYVRDNLSVEVPAVFWRFKTDYSEVPGPEQADYEFEEQPGYPQDQKTAPAGSEAVATSGDKAAAESSHEQENHYTSPHQTLNDMKVEEIELSMGEFDEFLKGASNNEKKD
jgi:hypothetical protein